MNLVWSSGPALEELREAHSLTHYRLAKLSGMTPGFVSRLESGQRHLSYDSVLRLTKALGLEGEERRRLFVSAGFSPSSRASFPEGGPCAGPPKHRRGCLNSERQRGQEDVLSEYILTAMQQARCKYVAEDDTWYAEIPQLPGVWAEGSTRDESLKRLQEVLEEWIVIRLAQRLPLPRLDEEEDPGEEEGEEEEAEEEEEELWEDLPLPYSRWEDVKSILLGILLAGALVLMILYGLSQVTHDSASATSTPPTSAGPALQRWPQSAPAPSRAEELEWRNMEGRYWQRVNELEQQLWKYEQRVRDLERRLEQEQLLREMCQNPAGIFSSSPWCY